MGRMPRIQVKNAIYYILSGGDNNEPIFRIPEDSATYLELLAQYKKQHRFKLFAYCLVPETISLLIEPTPDTSVSGIMHDLNSKYTKYFNRKYGKSGHLFQERYRMVLIEKESKLLEITAYINVRPKLHIPPYDINTYAYSSYLAYIREGGAAGGPDIKEEVKEALTYLKGDTYQEIVSQIALNKLSEIDKELATKPIIGSDKFVKDGKSKMKIEKNVPAESPKSVSNPEPEPILEPEPELESQPEPEPEQLSEPAPESLPQPKPCLAPDVKPVPKPKSNMVKSVLITALVIITISGAFILVYAKTTQMKAYLDKELSRKDIELKDRLNKERNNLYKILTDKHEAEKASYQETAQRLESEKETFKAAAERFEAEKNTYQEMANRLSDEKVSYQQAAERLEAEKKKVEEELTSIRKTVPEPVEK